MVTWFTQLVLQARVSMRSVSRVLQLVGERLGYKGLIPHWTTGRKWLQRLGYAQLTKPQPQAEDWAWLIDHTVQIGQEKCLVIVGVQLRNLPARGTSLRQEDLELIALLPRKSWTRAEVCEALEAAVARTGVPRVIVDDHGVDIAGGVSLFRQKHRTTVEIYDMQHKTACLLKQRLEKNPEWIQFQQALTRTRCAIQQTELGFLTPPSPRAKARFMNLECQLNWARHVLNILSQPPAIVLQKVTPERLQDKLGWLNDFRTAVGQWSEWQQLVQTAVKFVNQNGLYSGAVRDLKRILPKTPQHDSSRDLATTVLAFVREQAKKARPGERLPGSTEILESSFGKFKVLEREQSKGGFTSLVLAFGALLGKTTQQAITLALQQSPTQVVTDWCREHLGTTLFSQRRLAYEASATKEG